MSLLRNSCLLVCVLFVFLSNISFCVGDETEPGTSPDSPDQYSQSSGGGALITFDEFDVGTYITDQYADLGIVFGGDRPYIVNDASNPSSPVLTGTPTHRGEIKCYFVDPTDGMSPRPVSSFSLNAGYFNSLGSTRIEWFDLYGTKLGDALNTEYGIQHFDITGNDIASWSIDLIGTDMSGFAVDNVDYDANDLPCLIEFDKVDDIADGECVLPGDEITYTISWDHSCNPDGLTFDEVSIIDFLPYGVIYPGSTETFNPNDPLNPIPPDPNYDLNDHSYTWYIGEIAPGDSGSVTLTVIVDPNDRPGESLENIVEMQDAGSLIAWANEELYVCCDWGVGDPNVIYVDTTATGYNSGATWYDAFTDLQDALTRAKTSNCIPADGYKIYVAQGEYSPDEDDTFKLPDGVSLYGGFKTGGKDRNPDRYETILTGLIDEDAIPDVDTIVTMGDETLLDGFTVTKSLDYAVYGDGVDFTIENCVVKENYSYGVRATDGNVIIKWCQVSENLYHGISHDGEGFTLTVENSQVIRNMQHGIYCLNSTPTVKNSIICESGLGEDGHAGIGMINPTTTPILYNNTLANNKAEGISLTNNGDPDYFNYPDVQNCIVYYNNSGGEQLTGFSANDFAYFSCIQGCNEVNYNHNDKPGFAYTVDPNGTPDPENYHLEYNAFCKDKANPSLIYTGQVDMDGEGIDRKYGDDVDIGADEVYSCDDDLSEDDVYSELDWNADGIVNLYDLNYCFAAWLSHDPYDPALYDPNYAMYEHYTNPDDQLYVSQDDLDRWDAKCNLDTFNSPYAIDLHDTAAFSKQLWIACWKLEELAEAMAMSGGESAQSESMMMQPLTMDAFAAKSQPTAATVELQPEVSPDTLIQIIDFLDEVLADQPDNAENIEDMRAILIDELEAIFEQ